MKKEEKKGYINRGMVNDENQLPKISKHRPSKGASSSKAKPVETTPNKAPLNSTTTDLNKSTAPNPTQSNQPNPTQSNQPNPTQKNQPNPNKKNHPNPNQKNQPYATQSNQPRQPAQEEFVNQLIDKRDQVKGITLQFNRLWILFLKNIQLRMRKKFITLAEIFLPILIFIVGLHLINRIYPINNEKSNVGLQSFKSFNSSEDIIKIIFDLSKIFPSEKLYYDFVEESIDGEKLKKFLDNSIKGQKVRFERLTTQEITDFYYLLANFTIFNESQIDYKINIVDIKLKPYDYYFIEQPQLQIPRLAVDFLHQLILREMASKYNNETSKYSISFHPLDVNLPKSAKYKNDKVFVVYENLFFIAFFINGVFVVRGICNEKKTRSYEFLKLMGAKDEEILFGHFMNHFLFWLIPFTVCITYFWIFVPKSMMPTNIPIIFLFISLLILAFLICYIFMITSPFEKYIYAELVYVISAFACNFSIAYNGLPDGILGILVIGHPLNALQKLTDIFNKELVFEFNFEENLFVILNHHGEYSDQMSILYLILIIIGFMIIELGLTNYILQVNPFQNGISKPFYYLVMPSYWITHRPVTKYTQPNQKEFEKVPSYKNPAIILKNINKSFRSWLTFGKFEVLKNFNFAIYEKQITVLLGHNGAGKTTTMDIIAGLSCTDNGSVSVKGIPVSPYTSYFKKALGYCPQENIFYEDLTVYQNLKIAAYLKGCSVSSVNRKIQSLAGVFDLKPKLDDLAKNLSGGMKRRLVVAMAIIGFNDVLVIDEPTSGLDPENRRKVWEILLELRKQKTILLTTHFLEEADILGDSVAIMYDGKIKCSGSTLFLKKLYNIGYLLRLELNKEIKGNELENFIKNYVPSAIYQDRQANEYFVRLIQDEKNQNLNLKIADLFDAFENEKIKAKYGIQTYSLTSTSLEDVFIKIGTLEHPKDDNSIEMENAEDHPLHKLKRIKGINLYTQQFIAVFIKKLKLLIKNLQTFVSSLYPLLLPTLTILLYGLIITKLFPQILNMVSFRINSFDLKKNLGNKDVLILQNLIEKNFSEDQDPESYLFRPEKWNYLEDKFGFNIKSYNSNNILDTITEEKRRRGLDLFKNQVLFTVGRNSKYDYAFFINPCHNPIQFYPTSLIGTINSFYRTIAREKQKDVDIDVNLRFQFTNKLEESRTEAEKAFFMMIPYRAFKFFLDFLAVFCLCIVFSHPFSPFIDVLNDELISGALDMQIISGLSKTLYWISNFVFDFFYFIIIMAISCLSFYLLDYYDVFTAFISEVFLMFILAIFNCLLITYFIINLQLNKQATDIIVKYSIMIACLGIGVWDMVHYSVNVLTYPINPKTFKPEMSSSNSTVSLPFSYFFMVFSPPYNVVDQFFYYILEYLAYYCLTNENKPECRSMNRRTYKIEYKIAASMVSSLIFIFLIFLTNFYSNQIKKITEWLTTKLRLNKSKKEIEQLQTMQPRREINANLLYNDIEDPNIEKEKQLVQTLINTNNLKSNILIVHKLIKKFGNFLAVNDLSFTVNKQECFGLLGINGAGKTTTFKVIGGCHLASSGRVILDGYSYEKNPYKYYRRLAYCPQENTHTKRINVEDNLRFYARINGIPNKLIERTVKTLIDECDLKQHKYKFTEKLSGGNKRKLSTAIALIGKKDLVLLDEPTTGVDPLARRKLWKTINFYKKHLKTSFILTSHSMDEVEQLCSRISIMAAGKFKALGTLSYLKDRYSQGFTILIKIKEKNNKNEKIGQLKERVKIDFNDKAKLKEFYMNTMIYIILSKTFKWSHLFRTMEKIKADHNLDDFSISATNLEQIFLSFADK